MNADSSAPSHPSVLAALVGFPVALVAADLAAPSFAHGRDLAAAVAAQPGRTWLFVGLRLTDAALLLAVAGAIWLVARSSDRGRRTAAASAVLAVLGAIGQAQDGAYQLFVLSMQDEPAALAGSRLTALDRLAAPLELPLLLAFALALPLLIVSARLATRVPIWLVVAAVGAFLAHFVPGSIGSVAADLLVLVAFIGTAIAMNGRAAATRASSPTLATVPGPARRSSRSGSR